MVRGGGKGGSVMSGPGARGGGEVGSCARSSVRSQFGSNQTAQAIIAQAQSGLEWHCCLKTGNVAARRSTRACSSSRRCAYDSCMDHLRIRHRSVSTSRGFLCNPRRAKMNPRINGYQKIDPGERERETESLSSHVSSAGAPGPSMPIRAPGPGARPRAPGRAAAVVGRDDGLIEATASAGPFGGP